MAKQVPLERRLSGLTELVERSSGRVSDEAIDPAQALIERAGQRLAITGNHTVIALAGATGSGKSTTFNALSGTKLAEPGVRRPTTSKAMSASWGDSAPAELLDWLQVPRRHQIGDGPQEMAGLVLLDLPDHDSTELSHRAEVDRLVDLVDLLIWVVDPQKYADAALHDNYLKPLARHGEVMLVVLNQIDKLTSEQVKQCVADLRRLLDSEGLGQAKIAAVSSASGQGIAELRRQLLAMVKAKHITAERLGADITRAADAIGEQLGSGGSLEVGQGPIKQLTRAVSAAAGAEVVTDAVLQATRRRGAVITGWPALSWLASLRPDPLRRLRLDALPIGRRKPALEPARVQRTSITTGQGVAKSRVDSAVRALADDASAGLPRGWRDAVRSASRRSEAILPDELDRAVATTDLAMDRGFGYWRLIQVVQWLLIAVVVAGLGYLAADLVLAYFQFPPLPTTIWHRLPVQTWLVLGGVVAGLCLAAISRVFVEVTARAKASRARQVLGRSIAAVAAKQVVDPVNQELARLRSAREAWSTIR